MSLAGPFTLGDDESEGILAVVTFEPLAITEEETQLTLENVVIADGMGNEIGSCNPVNVVGITCGSGAVSAAEDGDGVPFGNDNCPWTYNAGQTNGDTDQWGDACDNCVLTANADQANSDTDDWGDACDNCVYVPNGDQANTLLGPIDNGPSITGDDVTNPYEDLIGDACDDDADNDGLPDALEFESACPYRLARDSDGDGSLDGYELGQSTNSCDAASKPLPGATSDSDGDGLVDGLELRGWGTDPYSPDSDGDSCDDDKEVASINADKQSNLSDVVTVARAAFGVIASHPAFDMDKNGVVNLSDAILAARNSTLLEPHSPCP
jgi:hypothetical protein